MKFQSFVSHLLGGALAGMASAAVPDLSGSIAADPVVPGAYIVELDDHDVTSFYKDLGASNLEVEPRLDLSHSLFKGCSFRLKNVSTDYADVAAKKISDLPKVRNVWPVRKRRLPNSKVLQTSDGKAYGLTLEKREGEFENKTFAPHVMTQVDKLRAEGVTGAGIRIGVIDTGVDYNHPALGNGCFGPGCIIAYGTDLVGDNFTGFNEPVPDKAPHDSCNGHGTHISGIIAAQPNEFGCTGAAPDATLGMYRAFGCNGESSDDVLIAAVKQAYVDGSDIITVSLGGSSGWAEDPLAVVVSRIVEAGVPCVAAMGDNGPAGPFYGSTPANGKGVTAVGSFDNTELPILYLGGTFTVDNSSAKTFGWWSGSPSYTNLSLPLWGIDCHVVGSSVPCSPLPDDTPDLSGYLVLLSKTTFCSYETVAQNVAAKGAKYIMFYSYVNEKADVSSVKEIVGVGSTPDLVGQQWCSYLQQGKEVIVHVTEPDHTKKIVEYEQPLWGRFQTSAVTYLSSWGPTWELDVKPQVSAPGENILSTYPLELGGYAVLGGTSSAAALTAAVYALVSQVRGTLDPSTLERLLSSTANPSIDPYVQPDGTIAVLAPVAQQGGGLIQAFDAAHTRTVISVASISFNDTTNFIPSADFNIQNLGSDEVTYEIGHVLALTKYALVGLGNYVNNPNNVIYANATLEFSVSKFTLPAGGSMNITVVPTPPSGLNETLLPIYSGYITVNGTNNDSLSIPYLGVVGSLNSAAGVLNSNGTFLANFTDPETPVHGTPVFAVPFPSDPATAPDNETGYPTAVIDLYLGTPLLKCDLLEYDAASPGAAVNLTTSNVIDLRINSSMMDYPVEYSQRGQYVSPFTGMLERNVVVPEGRYIFLVRALRIAGDPENEDDFDRITVGPFDIKYI
ncbi:subtilisin-like protein [Hypoxylon sp. FL0543]|nr:subtilisin-like protein [Hypoxylon sp. FL0543]